MDTGNLSNNSAAGSGRHQDPGKDTGFFLGQLAGRVGALGETVDKFDERLTKKEEIDLKRHEIQIKEQRLMGERIFEKIDEVKETAHAAPCSMVEAVENDISSLETRTKTVENCVRDIKTTARVSWRTIVIICSIIVGVAGLAGTVIVLWPKT